MEANMDSSRTDLSVMARMQIDATELSLRKQLMSFTDVDVSYLVQGGLFILPEIDGIIEEFYRIQLSFPQLASIIGDDQTLRRLQSAQRQYIEDLFSGEYDESYANNLLRVGLVHKHIGVLPKYYLSATKTLQKILNGAVANRISDPGLALGITVALEKLLSLDSALVIESYLQTSISELEVSAEKALAYTARMKEKIAEIETLARTDPLTGLPNRRAFLEELKKELGRATRHGEPVGLLYFDVDDFKSINDQHGHSKGDEQLQLIAKVLREVLRGTDFAGRMGGDEFCVAYSRANMEQSRMATERFLSRLKNVTSTTVSTGIATTGPRKFLVPEELIAKADELMLEVKAMNAQHRRKAAAAAERGMRVVRKRSSGS